MNYSFHNLSEAEVNLVATGLAELPWKAVNPLMQKLTAQVQEQEQASRAQAAAGGADTTAAGVPQAARPDAGAAP